MNNEKICVIGLGYIGLPTPFHEGYVPNIDHVVSATKAIVPYVRYCERTTISWSRDFGPVNDIPSSWDSWTEVQAPKFRKRSSFTVSKRGNIVILESTSPVGTTDRVEEVLKDEGVDTSKLYIAHCPKRVLPGQIMRELPENGRIVGGTIPQAKLKTVEGIEANIIKTAREVNNYKTEWVIEKIKNEALKFENQNGKRAKVACMGLAFKPDIDDLRESPALYITQRLISDGLDILAVEPNISKHNSLEIVDYEDAIKRADIVTFLVAHREFKSLGIQTNLDFCGVTK